MLFATLLISIDQFSKYMIRHFGGFYICNPDISFGIHLPSMLLYVLWTVILSVFLFFYLRNHHESAYIFMLSGAVSNLIDRAIHGCVLDFINLRFWPMFNIADIFILIGAIMLILKIKKRS